jgi:PTH1 family peptidyl-tRNA hydrolase
MWVIAGLGNPGKTYSRTRHNAGFMGISEIAQRHDIELREKSKKYIYGEGSIGGNDILLIEPLLFMNRSGLVIADILIKYDVPTGQLIVIHDDLDLDTGRVKIRKKGSSGGHRGIESIIQCTRATDFIRVKIGIGRDKDIPAEEYVLGTFRRIEVPLIRTAVKTASDAVVSILQDGIEKAMNTFNKRAVNA